MKRDLNHESANRLKRRNRATCKIRVVEDDNEYAVYHEYFGKRKPFKKGSNMWNFYEINKDFMTIEELKK